MSRCLAVRNPRSGETDYHIVAPTQAALDARFSEMRSAQPAWEALGPEGRTRVMLSWADAAEKAAPQIEEALFRDTGRRALSASEAQGVAKKIRRWCDEAPGLARSELAVSKMAPSVSYTVQYVPYPLIAIISPWNFPLSLALIDAIPALMAGCAVAVKPSELTPRFIAPLRETIAAAPQLAAIFEFVEGDGETGAAMIDRSDGVCFTGSVETGRQVAVQAARNFIPAFLELGGKDPAIILASADMDRAVTAVLRQALVNSGQVCLSVERVYVERPIFDLFVDRLVEAARRVEINVSGRNGGVLGPIIAVDQCETIETQIEDAIARGAEVQCGGTILRHGGAWLAPTVVTGVDHEMRLMREETFAPIIPVMPFDTVEEAVALANDSAFGLSAAVFAGTSEEALAVARRINAGGISINDAGLQSLTTEAEKHSFGHSGLGGSRMGAAGLMRFLRKKALMIQSGEPRTIFDFAEPTCSAGTSEG